jgi:hypothetical protein
MEATGRRRVTDALRYSGYATFLNALRTLTPVGVIALDKRSVEVRYAPEEEIEGGRRLLVVADRPLFFLGDPDKSRTGYELTIVDLRFDAQGGITGTMTGAPRVKPSPNGIQLDDYAEALVTLKAPPLEH